MFSKRLSLDVMLNAHFLGPTLQKKTRWSGASGLNLEDHGGLRWWSAAGCDALSHVRNSFCVCLKAACPSSLNRLHFFCRVLAQMKERLSAAQTGHSLLQRKSDAIKIALRAILKDIYRVKQEVIKRLQGAAYAQNNAVWAAGEFKLPPFPLSAFA